MQHAIATTEKRIAEVRPIADPSERLARIERQLAEVVKGETPQGMSGGESLSDIKRRLLVEKKNILFTEKKDAAQQELGTLQATLEGQCRRLAETEERWREVEYFRWSFESVAETPEFSSMPSAQ